MRITVNIDRKTLAALIAYTGEKNHEMAITKAVRALVRRHRLSEFGRLIRDSAFDYPDERVNQAVTNPIHPTYG